MLPKKPINYSDALFSGQLRSATVCQCCGKTSSRTDPFSELQLTFPSAFTPIVDIVVVSGETADVPPPAGYERLTTNLNQGRTAAPFTFLCIKRAPSWESHDTVPITDIDIVHDALLPGAPPPDHPFGYDVIPSDVNEGGGRRVFLAVLRVPGGSPITALQIVTNPVESTKPKKGPAGFTKIEHDLNLVTLFTRVLPCRVF